MMMCTLRIVLAALLLSAWQLAQTVTQVGHSAVWHPGASAIEALQAASKTGATGPDTLLEIMHAAGASPQATAFTRLRGTPGEYLANLYDERLTKSGKGWRALMSIGRIEFPLSAERPATFLVFRDGLPPLDLSDPRLTSHCDVSTAQDFRSLGYDKRAIKTLWSQPFDWTDEYPEAYDIDILVTYPIVSALSSAPVGYVNVHFFFDLKGALKGVRPDIAIKPNDVTPLHRGN